MYKASHGDRPKGPQPWLRWNPLDLDETAKGRSLPEKLKATTNEFNYLLVYW